jgi:adenine C2-methylase RlmN of 23S rRNA A2503 and tRNA A37
MWFLRCSGIADHPWLSKYLKQSSLTIFCCFLKLGSSLHFFFISYTCTNNSRIDRFAKVLIDYGLMLAARRIRGNDIDAARGQ